MTGAVMAEVPPAPMMARTSPRSGLVTLPTLTPAGRSLTSSVQTIELPTTLPSIGTETVSLTAAVALPLGAQLCRSTGTAVPPAVQLYWNQNVEQGPAAPVTR